MDHRIGPELNGPVQEFAVEVTRPPVPCSTASLLPDERGCHEPKGSWPFSPRAFTTWAADIPGPAGDQYLFIYTPFPVFKKSSMFNVQ